MSCLQLVPSNAKGLKMSYLQLLQSNAKGLKLSCLQLLQSNANGWRCLVHSCYKEMQRAEDVLFTAATKQCKGLKMSCLQLLQSNAKGWGYALQWQQNFISVHWIKHFLFQIHTAEKSPVYQWNIGFIPLSFNNIKIFKFLLLLLSLILIIINIIIKKVGCLT